MAHIYLTFDFGNDEEKAQQARHKLESWKQAFRLDKKMLFKFDRKEDGVPATAAPAETAEKEKPAKAATAKGAEAAIAESREAHGTASIKAFFRRRAIQECVLENHCRGGCGIFRDGFAVRRVDVAARIFCLRRESGIIKNCTRIR